MVTVDGGRVLKTEMDEAAISDPNELGQEELLIVGQFEGINNRGCGWGIEHE